MAETKNGNGKPPEPIRVGKLHLSYYIDMPGMLPTKVVQATKRGTASNQLRIDIDYKPWMRHHEVRIEQPGRGASVRNIQETHADWEPYVEG